jgi:cyclopropane fatty-acyl-phospholipid synthase-like methyltransferase
MRTEKKFSRHSIRNKLKKCDEELSLKNDKMLKYDCKIEVGNTEQLGLQKLDKTIDSYKRWSKEDGDHLIDTLIEKDTHEDRHYTEYLKQTKKQIQRRGQPEKFKSHLKLNNKTAV